MPSNSPPLASDNPHQSRIHAGRQDRRRELIDSLRRHADAELDPTDPCRDHPALRLAHKLEGCGRHPAILWSEDAQRLTVSRSLCKSRVCPTCGEKRARRLRSTLLPVVRELDSPRMITLTLAATDDDLEDQLKRLTDCFARLRRRKAAKAYLRGGVYVTEITYNPETDRWHPHLHIVAEGRYWPQRELAALWHTITGDSRICDIRACHDRRSTVNYVTSYVSKSQTPRDVPPERLWEWCRATHGRPLARPFGVCHGAKLSPKPEAHPSGLTHIAPLSPLLEAVQRGDDTASSLYARLMGTDQADAPADHTYDPSAAAELANELREELERWWDAIRYRQTGDPRFNPARHDPPPTPPPEPPPTLYS
jgi:hypothetical protein